MNEWWRVCTRLQAGSAGSAQPLFNPLKIAPTFQANSGLIDALMPDYIDYLGDEGPGSFDILYVRRGVFMPAVDTIRRELH